MHITELLEVLADKDAGVREGVVSVLCREPVGSTRSK